MLTLAEAKHNAKTYKKLMCCENNVHLRNHYHDKYEKAKAVLRNMVVNGSHHGHLGRE